VSDEDPIEVVPSDPTWPEQFRRIAGPLRAALGTAARRIDHVGSTAVPGLDAKPVIDVQISVASLADEATFRAPLEQLGFASHPPNLDRSQRFFREPAGQRRAHVHVRAAGSFDEQLNLLFRDYLRSSEPARRAYATVKRELAEMYRNDREGYVQAKGPTVWKLLEQAYDWLQQNGWAPGPSDA
jgi:GrpB-like predicted nucleotidyltransferase (UPF0157 family)